MDKYQRQALRKAFISRWGSFCLIRNVRNVFLAGYACLYMIGKIMLPAGLTIPP
jgi:hypothetical protein